MGPKQNASQRQSFPAYSFGLKRPAKKFDLTPGMIVLYSCTRFSSLLSTVSCSFYVLFLLLLFAVGPQYNSITSVGAQISSDKKSMPRFVFGTEDRVTPKSLRQDSKRSPGPKYHPTMVSIGGTGARSMVSHKPTAPSFGFGSSTRTREPNPYVTTPGPGERCCCNALTSAVCAECATMCRNTHYYLMSSFCIPYVIKCPAYFVLCIFIFAAGAYMHAYSVGKQAHSHQPSRPSAKVLQCGLHAWSFAIYTSRNSSCEQMQTRSHVRKMCACVRCFRLQFGTEKRDRRRVRQIPAPVGNRHSAIGKQSMSARSTAPSFSFGGR